MLFRSSFLPSNFFSFSLHLPNFFRFLFSSVLYVVFPLLSFFLFFFLSFFFLSHYVHTLLCHSLHSLISSLLQFLESNPSFRSQDLYFLNPTTCNTDDASPSIRTYNLSFLVFFSTIFSSNLSKKRLFLLKKIIFLVII